MPDQDTLQANLSDPRDDLADEIAASLASVSARFAGARPTGCVVEVDGGVVRRTLPDGLLEIPASGDGTDEGGSDGPPLTMSAYHRATSAAVSKITRRRVSARISKEDRETGAGTETFILEALTKKY